MIVKILLVFLYLLFTVFTIYRVSKFAETRPLYKYNIMAFGLPMWALSTFVTVWFVCVASDQHSRWLCIGWFAFYLLPICLIVACGFAKITEFFN
jgi:hypothetical protein